MLGLPYFGADVPLNDIPVNNFSLPTYSSRVRRDLYDTALAQHFITVNIISTIYDVDRDQFDECSIATSIPMHDGDDSASPHRFPLFFR